MKRNMGAGDRIIRILLAVVVATLYFTRQISGTAAIILGIFALLWIVTGIIGVCPAYIPFKISTKKKGA